MKSSASLALAQCALLLALVLALGLALRPSPAAPDDHAAHAAPFGGAGAGVSADQLTLCVAADLFNTERPQLQTSIRQPPGAAPWSLDVRSSCSPGHAPAPAVCTVTLRITLPQTQQHSQSEDVQASEDAEQPPPPVEINQSSSKNRPPERHDTHSWSHYTQHDHTEKDRKRTEFTNIPQGPPGISPQPRRLSQIKFYESLHSGVNPLLHPQTEHTRNLYHQSQPQPKPCLEPVCQSQPWWQQREQSQNHHRIVTQTVKKSSSAHSNVHPLLQKQPTEHVEAESYQVPDARHLQSPFAKVEAQNQRHQLELAPPTDHQQNEFSYQPTTEHIRNYEECQPESHPEQPLNLPPQNSSVHEYQPQHNTQEQAPAAKSQQELPLTIQRRFRDKHESETLSREPPQSVLSLGHTQNTGQEPGSHPTVLDETLSPTIQTEFIPASQHPSPIQDCVLSQPREIPHDIPSLPLQKKRSKLKATTSKWYPHCHLPWIITPCVFPDQSQCNAQPKTTCYCGMDTKCRKIARDIA